MGTAFATGFKSGRRHNSKLGFFNPFPLCLHLPASACWPLKEIAEAIRQWETKEDIERLGLKNYELRFGSLRRRGRR